MISAIVPRGGCDPVCELPVVCGEAPVSATDLLTGRCSRLACLWRLLLLGCDLGRSCRRLVLCCRRRSRPGRGVDCTTVASTFGCATTDPAESNTGGRLPCRGGGRCACPGSLRTRRRIGLALALDLVLRDGLHGRPVRLEDSFATGGAPAAASVCVSTQSWIN